MASDASYAKAFTCEYPHVVNALKTNCTIFNAFDPHSDEDKKNAISCDCMAIWDTGATGTVISSRVAKKLNLAPTGIVNICHANGRSFVNKYVINIWLPNQVGFAYLEVTEGELDESFDVLIGMDIISQGDMAITNVNRQTVFSFRTPSMERIDYVEDAGVKKSIALDPIKTGKKLGRNDLCPCGSGKKYKNCCMKKN